MFGHRVEFVSSLGFGAKDGEWRYAVIAIDGKLVTPFWVHESDWRKFDAAGDLDKFLIRQGLSLLDEYGDQHRQPLAS